MSRAVPRKWILLLAVGALCGYVLALGSRIAKQSYIDETQTADAIVVFGAAEYAGRPSPVLKARLDRGLELYRRGLAPLVIVTGGRGKDPNFSEGTVGRNYLAGKGIPDSALIAETQSDDTNESSERVAAILRANGKKTCLAVSDAYHMYRIKLMMAEQGITTYASPRPWEIRTPRWERWLYCLREVLSITLWRLHIR
jgi:uncharacterized SAM-binding protein YcdF (DUF218 family)